MITAQEAKQIATEYVTAQLTVLSIEEQVRNAAKTGKRYVQIADNQRTLAEEIVAANFIAFLTDLGYTVSYNVQNNVINISW